MEGEAGWLGWLAGRADGRLIVDQGSPNSLTNIAPAGLGGRLMEGPTFPKSLLCCARTLRCGSAPSARATERLD